MSVFCAAACRLQARRGGLKDTDAVDLLATVFKGVLEKTQVDPQVRGWGAICVLSDLLFAVCLALALTPRLFVFLDSLLGVVCCRTSVTS